jgi:Response regulator containing CheY-like receiver, AAA-type ATPase, and DNA-binding domains
MNKKKILICDDEIEIVNILRKFLENKDFLVEYALDGKEALAMIIHDAAYDIVFLDVNMPEFTGIDILKYMKENQLQARVVILTGYPGVAKDFCKMLGADEYLEKPIDLRVIGNIVDKYTRP